MDVPETVRTALADRPVEGRVCLEAGAGAGNTTAGLLVAGAARVYAVTDETEHARVVRDRVATNHPADRGRVAVLEADLRAIPLPDDAVGLVTAHGLCNVLPPGDLGPVAAELTRVAAPGCHLVVDDYAPLPADATIRELFALENAATELARGRPALTFYPGDLLQRLFAGHGWSFERRRVLLDPVPWTESHVAAHAEVAREAAGNLSAPLAGALTAEVDRVAGEIGSESVGEMYSLAFRFGQSGPS